MPGVITEKPTIEDIMLYYIKEVNGHAELD
jgi:hypothetical protein